MQKILLIILIIFFGLSTFAQKIISYGGEISVLSIRPNVRVWASKTTGYEVFGGLSSELGNLKPNDLEAGFKLLKCFNYDRNERTYFGIVGKWKWVNILGSIDKTNLPIPGFLIGKEWFSKRINLKSFAVELGYQYGVKEYNVNVYTVNKFTQTEKQTFNEFPLILNLRYSFDKKLRTKR